MINVSGTTRYDSDLNPTPPQHEAGLLAFPQTFSQTIIQMGGGEVDFPKNVQPAGSVLDILSNTWTDKRQTTFLFIFYSFTFIYCTT